MRVLKYGGATLDSPEKIKKIALQIKQELTHDPKILVVVSAMGTSTNQLLQLAHSVSPLPNLRELDMLLTTGERITASLLSMALYDLKISSISLTGSQAGIITNESHANAYIQNIRAHRVEEAFQNHSVVVLAGFQGVSQSSKNITTLGRGGSDTTAIAMSASLKASSCSILKDVTSIFSGDPKIIPNAKPISRLSYNELMTLTFWGAKVLNYRSAQLAFREKVPLFIGPAHSNAQGTWITEKKDLPMYESPQFVALSSHTSVLWIKGPNGIELNKKFNQLKNEIIQQQLIEPQNLLIETNEDQTLSVFLTGSEEALDLFKNYFSKNENWKIQKENLCSVTLLCSPTSSLDLQSHVLNLLGAQGIFPLRFIVTPHGFHFILDQNKKREAELSLHNLIT